MESFQFWTKERRGSEGSRSEPVDGPQSFEQVSIHVWFIFKELNKSMVIQDHDIMTKLVEVVGDRDQFELVLVR